MRNNYLIGQNGSPLKYEKGEIIPLDALIFKIAAVETLVRLGVYLKDSDCIGGAVAYEELCAKLDARFFDGETGTFRAAKESGGFSPYLNVASLLPLYVGAVKDKRKIWSVLRLFGDKNKFNADNGVPVLPADSPFSGRDFVDYNGKECEKYESFGGGVYPEFSLLAYFALIRVGADAEASKLAAKMQSAFEKTYEKGKLPRFYAPSGRRKQNSSEKFAEALLMPIAARYDRCGGEIFSTRKELRFSTALWRNGESQAVFFDGERLRFSSDGKILMVLRDGETVVSAEIPSKGALVVRNLRKEESGLSFIVDCPRDGLKITLDGKLFGDTGVLTAELPLGKSAVVADYREHKCKICRFNGSGSV